LNAPATEPLPIRIARRLLHIFRRIRARAKAERALKRRIGLLRRFPAEKLKDAQAVERLIISLGLYPWEAISLEQFPKTLWPFCNQGLGIWQYPNQFARCLVELSQYPIRTYLEIGVARGGTMITVIEYLKRFSRSIQAVGVDPLPIEPPLPAYARGNASLRYIQDFSSRLPAHLDWDRAFFDLVLIDGYHDEPVSWADFQLVKDRANIILFHDITNDLVPGVGASWERVKREHADEFKFIEFTEQYPEVTARTGRRYLGIGAAIRKDWRTCT
jgi:hypothetical protein